MRYTPNVAEAIVLMILFCVMLILQNPNRRHEAERIVNGLIIPVTYPAYLPTMGIHSPTMSRAKINRKFTPKKPNPQRIYLLPVALL